MSFLLSVPVWAQSYPQLGQGLESQRTINGQSADTATAKIALEMAQVYLDNGNPSAALFIIRRALRLQSEAKTRLALLRFLQKLSSIKL